MSWFIAISLFCACRQAIKLTAPHWVSIIAGQWHRGLAATATEWCQTHYDTRSDVIRPVGYSIVPGPKDVMPKFVSGNIVGRWVCITRMELWWQLNRAAVTPTTTFTSWQSNKTLLLRRSFPSTYTKTSVHTEAFNELSILLTVYIFNKHDKSPDFFALLSFHFWRPRQDSY